MVGGFRGGSRRLAKRVMVGVGASLLPACGLVLGLDEGTPLPIDASVDAPAGPFSEKGPDGAGGPENPQARPRLRTTLRACRRATRRFRRRRPSTDATTGDGCTPDPAWCDSHCGNGPDNCGEARQCPASCPQGYVCDSKNTCQCQAEATWCNGRCGQTTDNCGNPIDCGTCGASTCTPESTAQACGSRQCGQTTDNCERLVNCGLLTSVLCSGLFQVCLADGGCCSPDSAGACGNQCGTFATDNCGQSVQCPSSCGSKRVCFQNACCTPADACGGACGVARVDNCGQTGSVHVLERQRVRGGDERVLHAARVQRELRRQLRRGRELVLRRRRSAGRRRRCGRRRDGRCLPPRRERARVRSRRRRGRARGQHRRRDRRGVRMSHRVDVVSGLSMPFPPGTMVAGKYRIERQLAHGGMGYVVLARHVQLDQPVAMKFMHAWLANEIPEGAARFLDEGRAAARIRSDHVARVSDTGTLDDGSPYLVMEYLEGEDLEALLQKQRVLPVPLAVVYAMQAAEGLGEAHTAGIVHRDLKPSNLFLARQSDGSVRVKLLDFGISKMAYGADGSSRSDEVVEMNAAVCGSPLYMAPEQMRSSLGADPRVDIWAMGVVLYEMLAGARPFVGDTIAEICARVFDRPPVSLRALRSEIPAVLEAAVMQCLEKDPGSSISKHDGARPRAREVGSGRGEVQGGARRPSRPPARDSHRKATEPADRLAPGAPGLVDHDLVPARRRWDRGRHAVRKRPGDDEPEGGPHELPHPARLLSGGARERAGDHSHPARLLHAGPACDRSSRGCELATADRDESGFDAPGRRRCGADRGIGFPHRALDALRARCAAGGDPDGRCSCQSQRCQRPCRDPQPPGDDRGEPRRPRRPRRPAIATAAPIAAAPPIATSTAVGIAPPTAILAPGRSSPGKATPANRTPRRASGATPHAAAIGTSGFGGRE